MGKEVNWNSYTYLTKPGSASAGDWSKAIEKMIAMGAAMDPELLKKGAMAHHKAIGAVTEASPTLSKADFEAVNAAIGRMIASVPESQTMGVYDAVAALVPAEVPNYLMSTVKEADAKKAYEAFLTFKDVVKANPITPKVVDTPAALAGKLGRQAAAGGGDGPQQSPQQRGRQTRDRCSKLPSRKCSTRQGDCVRPNQPGHGCLQCRWQDHRLQHSKPTLFHVLP